MKIITNRALQKKIGWSPHKAQKEILRCKKRDIVISAGRGFGKSYLCAYCCLKSLLADDNKILIIAPTYDLTQRVFDYIVTWIVKNFPSLKVGISKRTPQKIETPWGSILKCKSAENPVGILGERFNLVIVDEAAKISRDVFQKYVFPTTQMRNGRTMFISTPQGMNWFHERWLQVGKGAFLFKSIDNPSFTEQDVERARKLLPEDLFRQEYEGSFVEGASTVFKESDIQDIINEKCLKDAVGNHFYVLGADLAKHQDFTVIDVIDKYTNALVYHERLNRIHYPYQKKRIVAVAQRYNRARVILDSSIDGDCNLFWKGNGRLEYGTMRELHESYLKGSDIEVLSLIDTANKKMRTVSNTGYPSIDKADIDWKPIRASINHGIQDVFEVELRDGKKVNATASHSFFKSKGFKSSLELASIHNTDSLIGISKKIEGNKTQNDLDFIAFLGLWIADGSFCKGSKWAISISTGCDEKIVSFIKKIDPKFKDYAERGDYVIWNRELKEKMLKYGIKNEWRSYTKRVPKWILTAGQEEVSAFLRGYFSGDGCVYTHKGFSVVQSSSVNYDLSSDVQVLLSRLGIRSVVGKGTKSKLSSHLQYPLTINWRKSVKRFKNGIGFINKDIPSLKKSKRKKQKSALQRIGIRRIRYLGKKEVYDLSVPETESFVVEGILCHNTGLGEPIYDDLLDTGLLVEDFKFTNSSKRKLVDKLRIYIEEKKLTIPNDQHLLDELRAFAYKISDSGNYKYAAPQGLHDDEVFALALAVWGLTGGVKPTNPIKRELVKITKRRNRTNTYL